MTTLVCCRCPQHSTRTTIDPECPCLDWTEDGPAVGCPTEHAEACHCPAEPRTFTVRYGLPRYQVRQHLELSGIDFTEDKRTLESVFTVSVTDLQWEAINEYAEKVKG